MNPSVVANIASVTIVLGIVALVFLFAWRSESERLLLAVGELWVKLAIESIQLPSAIGAIYAGFAKTEQKPEWFEPMLLASASFALWKFVQIVVDYRLKVELARANKKAAMLAQLVVCINSSVKKKMARVLDVAMGLARKGTDASIIHARQALTPVPHMDDLLEQLAYALCDQTMLEKNDSFDVRVGIYVLRGGHFEPENSVSLRNPSSRPLKSKIAHPPQPAASSTQHPSLVSKCATEKRTLIVADCLRAEKKGQFGYFRDEQREYLKSMVCFFMGDVQHVGGTTVVVIAVDSDVAGLFKETERNTIERVLRAFALRVRLEFAIQSLIKG